MEHNFLSYTLTEEEMTALLAYGLDHISQPILIKMLCLQNSNIFFKTF